MRTHYPNILNACDTDPKTGAIIPRSPIAPQSQATPEAAPIHAHAPAIGPVRALSFTPAITPASIEGPSPIHKPQIPVWRACEPCRKSRACTHKNAMLLPLKSDGPDATLTVIQDCLLSQPPFGRVKQPPKKRVRVRRKPEHLQQKRGPKPGWKVKKREEEERRRLAGDEEEEEEEDYDEDYDEHYDEDYDEDDDSMEGDEMDIDQDYTQQQEDDLPHGTRNSVTEQGRPQEALMRHPAVSFTNILNISPEQPVHPAQASVTPYYTYNPTETAKSPLRSETPSSSFAPVDRSPAFRANKSPENSSTNQPVPPQQPSPRASPRECESPPCPSENQPVYHRTPSNSSLHDSVDNSSEYADCIIVALEEPTLINAPVLPHVSPPVPTPVEHSKPAPRSPAFTSTPRVPKSGIADRAITKMSPAAPGTLATRATRKRSLADPTNPVVANNALAPSIKCPRRTCATAASRRKQARAGPALSTDFRDALEVDLEIPKVVPFIRSRVEHGKQSERPERVMRTYLTGTKNRKDFAATDHLVKVPPELRVSSGSTSLTPPCEEEDKAPDNDVKKKRGILGNIPLVSPVPRKEPAIVTPPAPAEEKREEPRRSKRQLEITAGVEKGGEAKRKAAETVEHEKMVPVVVIPAAYVEEDEDDEPVTDRSRKAKSKPISSSAPSPQLIAPVAVMHSHRNEEVQEEGPVRDRRIEGGSKLTMRSATPLASVAVMIPPAHDEEDEDEEPVSNRSKKSKSRSGTRCPTPTELPPPLAEVYVTPPPYRGYEKGELVSGRRKKSKNKSAIRSATPQTPISKEIHVGPQHHHDDDNDDDSAPLWNRRRRSKSKSHIRSASLQMLVAEEFYGAQENDGDDEDEEPVSDRDRRTRSRSATRSSAPMQPPPPVTEAFITPQFDDDGEDSEPVTNRRRRRQRRSMSPQSEIRVCRVERTPTPEFERVDYERIPAPAGGQVYDTRRSPTPVIEEEPDVFIKVEEDGTNYGDWGIEQMRSDTSTLIEGTACPTSTTIQDHSSHHGDLYSVNPRQPSSIISWSTRPRVAASRPAEDPSPMDWTFNSISNSNHWPGQPLPNEGPPISPTTQNNKPFTSYYRHESRYYTAQTPATVFTQTSSVVVFSSGSSSSQQLSPFATPESTSTQDTANTTLERGSYAEAATQTAQSQGYANACTQTTPPPPDHRYRRSTTPYSPAPGYLSRAPSSRPGGSSNPSARGHPLARTPPWRKPNNEGYYRRWERPAGFGESSRGVLGPPYERDRNRERDGDWNELRRWHGDSWIRRNRWEREQRVDNRWNRGYGYERENRIDNRWDRDSRRQRDGMAVDRDGDKPWDQGAIDSRGGAWAGDENKEN